MNLAFECLERNIGRVPNRLAVINGETGRTYTYLQLNEEVNRMANALLSLGVAKGDRVAIYMRNSPEFIIAVMANSKIGAITVPFNIMLRKLEIDYILNNSGAKVVFGAAPETVDNILPILDKLPQVEKIITVGQVPEEAGSDLLIDFEELSAGQSDGFQALDLAEDEPVSLLYTSGTTGNPKGALATHANWLAQTIGSAYQIVPMTDEDLVLTGGPFFHVYLVIAVLPTLYVGATVITLQRFFPAPALELITKHKASHFMGTPTMWTYMIEEYLGNKDSTSLG